MATDANPPAQTPNQRTPRSGKAGRSGLFQQPVNTTPDAYHAPSVSCRISNRLYRPTPPCPSPALSGNRTDRSGLGRLLRRSSGTRFSRAVRATRGDRLSLWLALRPLPSISAACSVLPSPTINTMPVESRGRRSDHLANPGHRATRLVRRAVASPALTASRQGQGRMPRPSPHQAPPHEISAPPAAPRLPKGRGSGRR